MLDPRIIVDDLLAEHAQKAHESEYDRAVVISAIAAVRDAIAAVPVSLSDEDYCRQVRAVVADLMDRYRDPAGEFTSGKSVIGSFLTDLYVRLERH